MGEYMDLINSKDLKGLETKEVESIFQTLQNNKLYAESSEVMKNLKKQPKRAPEDDDQDEIISNIEDILSCFPDLTDFKKKLIIEQYKMGEKVKPNFFDAISVEDFENLLSNPKFEKLQKDQYDKYMEQFGSDVEQKQREEKDMLKFVSEHLKQRAQMAKRDSGTKI